MTVASRPSVRRSHNGRWTAAGAGVAIAVTVIGIPAGVAFADAAGPTDYASTITSIEPETAGIDVRVIGGGSFLELAVDRGVDVIVFGYEQEPYLHVRADGVVERNQRSPATYLNTSAGSGGDVPAGADPSLPPAWERVGSGGTFAWHDHRAHWMSPDPPPGATHDAPIQEATVPLLVDGTPVAVGVRTMWLTAPSRLPLAIGAAAGAAIVLLALARRARLAGALLTVAIAAGAIGWWQYRSLPPETGPLIVWWALPAVAAASIVVALVLGRHLVSYALVLLAAIELGLWVWVRRDSAFRALIPTDAPYWLDRGVMAATVVVAVIAGLGAAVAMFRPPVGSD